MLYGRRIIWLLVLVLIELRTRTTSSTEPLLFPHSFALFGIIIDRKMRGRGELR